MRTEGAGMGRAGTEDAPETLAWRQAIRQRDPAAWRELAAMYSCNLNRRARLILPPGLDPEDAAAEVWVRAYRMAESYDASRPPFPWLAKICVNVCLNKLRRPRLLFFRGNLDRVARAERPAELEGASAVIREALSELSPRLREVLALRYLFEIAPSEIGIVLGIRKESVEIYIVRGLAALRVGKCAEALRAFVVGAGGAHS